MANSGPIEIRKYLKGVDYPASKDDVLKKARSNGAKKYIFRYLKT